MTVNELLQVVGAVPGVSGTIRVGSPKPFVVVVDISGGDLDEICEAVRGRAVAGIAHVIRHTADDGRTEERVVP